jgi:hypothetical protein
MRNYDPTSRKLQHKLCDQFWQAEDIVFQIRKCLPKSTPWKVPIFGDKC